MGFLGLVATFMMRLNLSVAIVDMTYRPQLDVNESLFSPANNSNIEMDLCPLYDNMTSDILSQVRWNSL